MWSQNKFLLIVGILGLYLVSTGISYASFSYLGTSQQDILNIADVSNSGTETKRGRIDPSEPKTEACPLNGVLYTKTEKDIWDNRRPLAVMVENHVESRPQSGLSSTDILYEAVAEGGITRFMGVFLCGASAMDIDVGPVRSARTYFLDWVSEYGSYPLYVHVGGANCNATTGHGCANGAKADALGQIKKDGWNLYNDLNQMIGGDVGYPVFKRDNRLEIYNNLDHIAYEHTVYSTTDSLWEVAANRGLSYTDADGEAWDESYISWSFKEPSPASDPTASLITYDFWENHLTPDYTVAWQYEPQTNTYLRSTGDKPHLDYNTEQPLATKNLVIAFMRESKANDGYPDNIHLLYGTIGTGEAIFFIDGQVTEGNWSKKTRTSRTIFTDEAGQEISFNPGHIWISVLPVGKTVDYQ
jgi:hypothetical protein